MCCTGFVRGNKGFAKEKWSLTSCIHVKLGLVMSKKFLNNMEARERKVLHRFYEGKQRMYKRKVKLHLIYTCVTWFMSKKLLNNIETGDRKVPHKFYGGKKTEEGWERKTNKKRYEIFNEPITAVVKSKTNNCSGEVKKFAVIETHGTIWWREGV